MNVVNDSRPSVTMVRGSINVCCIDLLHCYTELLSTATCYFKWLKDETAASFSGVHMGVSINAISKLTLVHLTRWKPEKNRMGSRLSATVADVHQGPRVLRGKKYMDTSRHVTNTC